MAQKVKEEQTGNGHLGGNLRALVGKMSLE